MGEHTRPGPAGQALDLAPRRRGGFTVTVDLCTWDLTVFRVHPDAGGRPVFVARREDEVRDFLRDLDAGRRDADLLAALARPPRRRLARPPRPRRDLRLGVEHEYRLHGPEGRVDVRGVIDGLDLGVRADPTDPHAQRGPWGGVVTADGAEAEVATPPVVAGPGAAADVVELARRGRDTLERSLAAALGGGHHLEGYSTHLNVSAPRWGDRGLATTFATVFAPALMLLLDRPTSPGLLVRPRPGRLELGGEFCDGEELEVALVFALGAVLACRGRQGRAARRLAVDLALQPARERYGWYVDRRSVGADLYEGGRGTALSRRGSGEVVTAGRHLEQAWALARARLAPLVGDDELARVDAVVGGTAPLPRPQEGEAS
ncbi:hypothetical protein [Oryzobacter terrae]|uniref:hypothetical protein n=1 Tax=Oryzobacter terrae TaxID=1620385 RepID=UPI00366F9FB9